MTVSALKRALRRLSPWHRGYDAGYQKGVANVAAALEKAQNLGIFMAVDLEEAARRISVAMQGRRR